MAVAAAQTKGPSTPASLQLVDLVKRYDRTTAVGPVSFCVGQGEFVSLLGPSGCGKTTLLRAIAGFETPDSGSILVDGADIGNLPAHRRGVGLVFQHYALFPHLSIFDNVAFGLRLRKRPKSELADRVAAVLRSVSLTGFEHRMPAQISGGQQQRVAIARSLVLEPKLLLLDEPLSNLDFKLRIQMRHELRQMQQQLGMTFIYVTHDQTEAMALSDRIVVLRDGRVEQLGVPEEIYSAPKTRFVADFIGTTNLLPGRVETVEADGIASVRLESGVVLRGRQAIAMEPGEQASVCIRPENVHMTEPVADEPKRNILWATPASAVFSGERTEIVAQLEAGAAQIIFYLNRPGALPDRICLGFPVADTIIVAAT